MNKSTQKLEKVITGIISIGFAVWSAAFIYQASIIAIDGKRYFALFDDAMISMRYAWNFSHGAGLVWNPGEYIQGYTNLLMVLLMSVSTLLFDKSTAALIIQISGIAFMLAIAYTSMRIADHFIQDDSYQRQSLIRVIVFSCTLTYYPLVFWSLLGMETGLLTLLCLLGVLGALNYIENKQPQFMLLVSICFGLAYLTRNDSIIVAALAWLYITCGVIGSNARSKDILHLGAGIGLYALFIIGQAIFQYSYYGELLPNTYYLKLTGMPLIERINNGIGYVTPFVIGAAFILAVSSLYVIVNFRKQSLLLISIAFAAIGYQIYVGGDAFVLWRMLSPSVPFIFILFICAIATFVDSLFNAVKVKDYFIHYPNLPIRYVTEASIVLLTLMGSLSMNIRYLPWIYSAKISGGTKTFEFDINTALMINELTTSDASVGVFHAGLVPYYTGRQAIDFLGKCDRYIARLTPDLSGKISWSGMNSVPGHNKYDLNYSIKTLQPTYVERFYWGSQDLSEWASGKYVKVHFAGGSLFFLKDSPSVLWEKTHPQ
jgi:arabinofuranosyltransferase